jgi:beta-lactamase class A
MASALIHPLAVLALCQFCFADSVLDLLERNTLARIRSYERGFDGALGVAVIDLHTGREFSLNGDVLFPQASSIKIPILIRMFQAARDGEFRMSGPVTLTREDLAGGSGHLQKELANGPVTLTVYDLVTAMMETSDNTATNKCIAMLGMERVNRMLDEMGFVHTRLRRRMMDADSVARGLENISTPREMVRIVERIYGGRAVDEKASGEMIAIMRKVKAGMRAAVPDGIATASKPGAVPGVKCETGIVYTPNRPFVISVMSTFTGDSSTAVADVTRIVYAHFEKLGAANEWGHRRR